MCQLIFSPSTGMSSTHHRDEYSHRRDEYLSSFEIFSLRILSFTILIPSRLPSALQKKKMFVFVWQSRECSDCRNVTDRCKSHDFHRLEMSSIEKKSTKLDIHCRKCGNHTGKAQHMMWHRRGTEVTEILVHFRRPSQQVSEGGSVKEYVTELREHVRIRTWLPE